MSNSLGVIYARQSSGKDEESESIQMQIEKCQELASKTGIHIIATYYDTDTSGRTYPIGAEAVAELDLAFHEWFRQSTLSRKYRSGLGNVLAWLPRIDCILVYDITRLYRPLQHSFLQGYIDSLLVTNHVRIITCTDGESDPGKFSDNLVSSIRSSVNDNQIRLTSEKSRLALRKLRDAGYYPNAPKMYGIRYLGGKNRKIEIIPAEAEMVRFVFQQALAGRSFHGIVREMNRRFTTVRRGKCFHLSTLRNILSNPIYCGCMYDSNHNLINCNQMKEKEIITYKQWLDMQERLHGNGNWKNKTIAGHNPFSGLLFCGKCGAPLCHGRDKGKDFYYCRRGLLTNDRMCSASRITVTLATTPRAVIALKDAMAPFLLWGVRDLNRIKYLQDPRTILENRLAEKEYARLLKLAIQRITIFSGYILVQTAEKEIRLDRVIWHRSRIFPKFKARVNRDNEGLAKKIYVHYRYPCGEDRKLIVVFETDDQSSGGHPRTPV